MLFICLVNSKLFIKGLFREDTPVFLLLLFFSGDGPLKLFGGQTMKEIYFSNGQLGIF